MLDINKQNMKYSRQGQRTVVYETDSEGNIIYEGYTDSEGNLMTMVIRYRASRRNT